mgnify:CR=1 FL=1
MLLTNPLLTAVLLTRTLLNGPLQGLGTYVGFR